MNGKLLVVVYEPVSSALIQTLSLMSSYQFEQINSPKFTGIESFINELEKYKDEKDIKGLILSEPEGIDLAKHIRFTEALGNLRLLPIVVLSPISLRQHLNMKKDNIFLLSPCCQLISIFNFLPEIFEIIEETKSLESVEKMREDIKPFIIWSEEDDVVSSHDNFNRYGPFKLMKEHFGQVPEQLSKDYEKMTMSLWFKKYQFLESQDSMQSIKVIDEDIFKKTVANKKILYIDDEHRLGWSFALYSLITGNNNHNAYQVFQDSDHFITSPDNKLACLDNYDESRTIFENYKENFKAALSEYSESEHVRNLLTEEFTKKQSGFIEIERKYKNARELLERTETNLQDTEDQWKNIHKKVKISMDALVDAYIQGTEDIEINEVQPKIKELANSNEQYEKELTSLIKYKEELKRNKKLCENLKNDFERQHGSLKEAESKKSSVVNRYNESLKALYPSTLFPYDLVILDLRLEKNADREATIHEISGIKMLKKIKECDPSIPVIMFTASQKAINYKEAVELGASGYWMKAINSSSDLKNEIICSIEDAREMRNLWLSIKKIEVKKRVTYLREDHHTHVLEKNIMSDTQKSEITLLLKESFLLFKREVSPYEEFVCNYDNYSKIALNMGLIQEERFGRMRGEKWDKWVRQRKIDKDEVMIRQLRNKAAHQAGSKINKGEALKVFQMTLERCLRT